MIVAASIVVFLLVIARVVGLVKQNERTVARERALRLANLALVKATTSPEIAAAALRTAQLLVDGAGEARVCVQRPTGMVLVTASGGGEGTLLPATVALLELAATTPSVHVELPPEAYDELDLPRGAVRANVFPLAARDDQRGLLIAAAPTPFSPILVEALDALCASVSLALESAALSEQAHRRENEARFASLVRNASDLITVVDRDGDVLYQSPSIQRILGLAPMTSPERASRTCFCTLIASGCGSCCRPRATAHRALKRSTARSFTATVARSSSRSWQPTSATTSTSAASCSTAGTRASARRSRSNWRTRRSTTP